LKELKYIEIRSISNRLLLSSDKYDLIEKGNWIASNMDGARIFSPNRTIVKLAADIAGSETGYVLNRELFDKESFHLVLSQNAIDHSINPKKFVNNISYVTKLNGLIQRLAKWNTGFWRLLGNIGIAASIGFRCMPTYSPALPPA